MDFGVPKSAQFPSVSKKYICLLHHHQTRNIQCRVELATKNPDKLRQGVEYEIEYYPPEQVHESTQECVSHR